jgi:hypothetical protein
VRKSLLLPDGEQNASGKHRPGAGYQGGLSGGCLRPGSIASDDVDRDAETVGFTVRWELQRERSLANNHNKASLSSPAQISDRFLADLTLSKCAKCAPELTINRYLGRRSAWPARCVHYLIT